jgi:3-hydroxyisobutyrate dehydrogenase
VNPPGITPADPSRTRIGWIGTGVMGASMCSRVMASGYAVTVSTRTRGKAEPLLAAGAAWAETPREVAARSDVIFTMVGYPDDVRAVFLADDGILGNASPGTIAVDMTTSDPALAVQLGLDGQSHGVHVLDAPVSGGDIGARDGTLSIMVGGPEAVFEAVLPCFTVMGSTVLRQGDHGAGQHTKMVNQTLVAANIVGVCEALLYASRAGLDLHQVLDSVARGAGGSWSLTNLGPRILHGDYSW